MNEILVIAEHRGGELRDITLEMLSKAREIAEGAGCRLSAVIMGRDVARMAEVLSTYSERVLVIEDDGLEPFDPDLYEEALSRIITDRRPLLTMIGHTAYGLEIAPSLAVSLDIPLVTDCIDLSLAGGRLTALRQVYGGKVYARVKVRESDSYMVTMRPGLSRPAPVERRGEVIHLDLPLSRRPRHKKVLGYVSPPKGEIDISSADIIVSIGRGFGDRSRITLAEELAKILGGALACSRPIVDYGWLPPDRLVGSSGKTVRPKLYLALGISGAFQHVLGMKDSQLIISVNKDPGAPIFSISHYGVVEDLFRILPALIRKVREVKGSSHSRPSPDG